MNKPLLYIIIGVIAVAAIFFLFKGCKASKAQTKALTDSLVYYRNVSDSNHKNVIIVTKFNDSVVGKNHKDSIWYNQKINDQAHVIAVLNGRYSKIKDSIPNDYALLKKFYLDHDTTALYETYNRLNQELIDANNLLFSIQLARDSSDNIRVSEIERLNGVIKTTRQSLAAFKLAYEDELNTTKGLSTALNKSIKQQKRTLILGILQKVGYALGGFFIGRVK
jgi:hypothetical protein